MGPILSAHSESTRTGYPGSRSQQSIPLYKTKSLSIIIQPSTRRQSIQIQHSPRQSPKRSLQNYRSEEKLKISTTVCKTRLEIKKAIIFCVYTSKIKKGDADLHSPLHRLLS